MEILRTSANELLRSPICEILRYEIPQPIPANTKLGLLYNFYVVADARNIMPEGWHIPTVTETGVLNTYLGDILVSGGKLKENSLTYWQTPNTGADNSSAFNGRGAGVRLNTTGAFQNINQALWFWTSTEVSSTIARSTQLVYDSASWAYNNLSSKQYGQSIRGIKDSTTLSHGETSTMIGCDGKIYNTICIGTQEWMSENYKSKVYRNGDSIELATGNSFWITKITGAYCAYNNDLANV